MSYKITFGASSLSISEFVGRVENISKTMCDNCGANCSTKGSASKIHIQSTDPREAMVKCDYYCPKDNCTDSTTD